MAAAARTANSDQPLPVSQPSLPCSRPPFQSSPHSQRRRASHLACACHTLTHSPTPTPTAGCRLSLSSPAAGLVAAAAAARRHFQSLPLSRIRVGVRGCRATTQMLRSSASAAQLGPARLDSSSPLSRALLLLPLPPFSSLSTPLPVSYCPHHRPLCPPPSPPLPLRISAVACDTHPPPWTRPAPIRLSNHLLLPLLRRP